ncbi:MAG: glycine cleavage system protein GcvH [Planctomycetota bacterium]|nr:MAG: glycine cleavage system protein GcvH [Planctomycetota bacterium]REJ94510.1 MAG: glycine cleavage system protein GcvH [Planctomycetota bacterium]REK21285.1 MAG: glycine cleavage system protein GcvH [Planctomycetota bacterium]REK32078.1 MAG: glycine cleavage system protein GcvH [Planctomycetota bacterium]
MDPNTLKFATSHEWVHLDDGTATVGISDFAVRELTDLVYIELPEVGRTVSIGDSFGEVESVKAVSDLYAPVAGEIVEVNEALRNDLSPLSDDAFGAGWIAKIKTDNSSETSELMDYNAYQKFCESEKG